MKGIERKPDGKIEVDLLGVDAGKPNWLTARMKRVVAGGWPAFKKRRDQKRDARKS